MILCTNFYIFLFEVSLDACTNESINFERTVAEVSLGACTNDESINFEKTVAEVSLSACTNDESINFEKTLAEVSLVACTNESINFEKTVAEVSLGACTNDESINFEKTLAEVSLGACTNAESSGRPSEIVELDKPSMDTDNDPEVLDSKTLHEGDWCLFEYVFDSSVYYVGKIVQVNDGKVTADFLQCAFKDPAKFLEKAGGSGVEEAELEQIVLKLGNPIRSSDVSKRQKAFLKFDFDFSPYNLGNRSIMDKPRIKLW